MDISKSIFHKFELSCIRQRVLPNFNSLVHCLAETSFLSTLKHWRYDVCISKRQLIYFYLMKSVIFKTNITLKDKISWYCKFLQLMHLGGKSQKVIRFSHSIFKWKKKKDLLET